MGKNEKRKKFIDCRSTTLPRSLIVAVAPTTTTTIGHCCYHEPSSATATATFKEGRKKRVAEMPEMRN